MSSGDDTGERNPFAPPPADAPDQPWQPRGPRPGEGGVQGPSGEGGTGSGSGSDSGSGFGSGSGSGERPPFPPPWGAGLGDGRPGQRPPAPQPPRLDPANPAHRRARNAALAGPLALVCLFLGFHWAALLVGLLGIVWGVSALRSPKPADGRTGGTPYEAPAPNPLTPAALAGILTGAMTVVVTTSVIGLGLYYNEYATCVKDSLTSVGAQNCDRYAPKWYVDFTGNAE